MPADIKYTISIPNRNNHLIHVTCIVKKPDLKGQEISFPAWILGSYKIRDLAQNIVTIQAKSNNQDLDIIKIDKQTWRLPPNLKTVTITYTIFAFDDSPRGAYVDNYQAFWDSARIFIRIHGKEKIQTLINIAPMNSWQLATTITPSKINANGFGSYLCADYFSLIDSPVVCGHLTILNFTIDNIPHKIILPSAPPFAQERLLRDVTAICNTHKTMFTELPHITQYIFYLQATTGYGGLEHFNSSSLKCSRESLPYIDKTPPHDAYINLLNLISHEYLHMWLIKSIKPQALAVPDLSQENYLNELWLYEGVTSYYDELGVLHAGSITTDNYLALLTNKINKYLSCPGTNIQTLQQSSFDTWIKFYQPDVNTPNAETNYYLKGSIVACLLDLKLLSMSNGTIRLSSLLRLLWQQFGNNQKYVPDGFFAQLIAQKTNIDIKNFLHLALYTTKPLPLQETFALVGLELTNTIIDPILTLGLIFNKDNLKISHVLNNSPAEQAGLAPNDEIIAINNIRINSHDLLETIKRNQQDLIISFFRDSILHTTKLPLPSTSIYKIMLQLNDTANKHACDLRNAWLLN